MGFVLAPPPLNRFYCIFPSDANSMGGIEHQGKMGIIDPAKACGQQCNPPVFMGTHQQACSFPPERLADALQANANFSFSSRFKYNEIIMDAQQMKARLPQ